MGKMLDKSLQEGGSQMVMLSFVRLARCKSEREKTIRKTKSQIVGPARNGRGAMVGLSRIFCCLLVVCGMLLVEGAFERANATNYTISSSLDSTAAPGTCTLRKALQNQFDWASGNPPSEAACAASNGNDVITLTTGVNLDSNATLPTIAGNVRIIGGQTIDGSANGNSFIFTLGELNGHVGHLELESITLTGALQSAVMLNNNTSLSVNIGTFSNNSNSSGGAISGQGTISLNAVHFTDNSATSVRRSDLPQQPAAPPQSRTLVW
jgi:predicted outer membrane repeat protein